MIFKWNEKFSTGITEIDKQHKRLFEIGTELYNIATLEDGLDHYDEIVKLLNDLKDYTVYHFNYEEEYMEKFNYKDTAQHKKEHQLFVEKLMEIESQDIDMEQKKVILDTISFIVDWISNHIMGSDFKYKELFMKSME